MAGPWYCDDGGSTTSPYDTWAKAHPALGTLIGLITPAAGEIIYVGSDHVEAAFASTITFKGANASQNPVRYVSADITSGNPPTTYQSMVDGVGSIAQSGTGSDVVFADAIHLEGLYLKIADQLTINGGVVDEAVTRAVDCKFEWQNLGKYMHFGANYARANFVDCDFVWPSSDTTGGIRFWTASTSARFVGCTFSATNHARLIVDGRGDTSKIELIACDLSGYGDSATTFSVADDAADTQVEIIGCSLPEPTTFQRFDATPSGEASVLISNSDNTTDDNPYRLEWENRLGAQLSDTATYLSGGFQPPGSANPISHEITLNDAQEKNPFRTRDLAVKMETSTQSSVSATLEFLITDASATTDLTPAHLALVLEYAGTASSVLWTHNSQELDIISAAQSPSAHAAGTDSWTEGATAHKAQKAVISGININTANTIRRAYVLVTSLNGNDNLYINPVVTIA